MNRITSQLGALGERQFRLLFIGQSVSLLGDGMVGVAIAFAVLDLTGSVSDLGFVFGARTSRSSSSCSPAACSRIGSRAAR